VKIFDFGLATQMVDSRKVEGTDTYLFTKDTGSPRYMAPEVFKGVPYNEKCDVYSFGLILWYCIELAIPFEKYDIVKMNKNVFNGTVTPKLKSRSLSQRMKDLLSNCWERDFGKRHSLDKVMRILRNELEESNGYVNCDLDDSSKTDRSLRNK
jgi:serine/threonine protein kinase